MTIRNGQIHSINFFSYHTFLLQLESFCWTGPNAVPWRHRRPIWLKKASDAFIDSALDQTLEFSSQSMNLICWLDMEVWGLSRFCKEGSGINFIIDLYVEQENRDRRKLFRRNLWMKVDTVTISCKYQEEWVEEIRAVTLDIRNANNVSATLSHSWVSGFMNIKVLLSHWS